MGKFSLVKNTYHVEGVSCQGVKWCPKCFFLLPVPLPLLPTRCTGSGHIKQVLHFVPSPTVTRTDAVNCSQGFTRGQSRKALLTCHCFISSLTPLESSRSLSLWVASCRTLAVVSASVSQARNFSRSRGNCCSNLWVSSRAASRSLTLQKNKGPDAALLGYHNGAPRAPHEKSKDQGTKL